MSKNLEDFFAACPESDLPQVYEMVCGMAIANVFYTEKGIYNKGSVHFRFLEAIFIQTRNKVREVFGKDELDRLTNQFTGDNLSELKGILDKFLNN